MTVAETRQFLSDSDGLFNEAERASIVWFLAENPEAGAIMPGTGGVRKLRWARPGTGKRGGGRVIYYFHDAGMPLFLLMAYAKNERDDLTQAEKNAMKRLIPILVNSYRKPKEPGR